MAKKTIGKSYYRGVGNGGLSYYAGRCQSCGEEIYLLEDDAQKFVDNSSLFFRKNSIVKLILSRVGERIPRIKVSFQWSKNKVEKEIEKLESYQEQGEIFNPAIVQSIKKRIIDLDYFNATYRDKGGVEKLKEMVERKSKLREIANHFGFSNEWARKAKMAIFGSK